MSPPDAVPRNPGEIASLLRAVYRPRDVDPCRREVAAWLRLAPGARGGRDGA